MLWVTANSLCGGGAGEAEDALHVEAVGAFLEGADRGVGEGTTGDDRGLALDQRRRARAEGPLGGRVEMEVPQFGGPLGRRDVGVDGDYRGGEGLLEAGT